jgi:hypothetical protein
VEVQWETVGDVSFQIFQAPYSLGLIEQDRPTLNQPPGFMVLDIEDTDSPSPHDHNFVNVQTLKLCEAPNGGDDLRSRTKQFQPRFCFL